MVLQEGPSQPSMFLSYRAPGGLSNQLYAHLNMLGLALALNAALALPPALRRDSYENLRYSQFFKEPIESLLDLGKTQEHWGRNGLDVSKVFPACSVAAHVQW